MNPKKDKEINHIFEGLKPQVKVYFSSEIWRKKYPKVSAVAFWTARAMYERMRVI